MMYDITFCNDDKCIHTECERHLKNVPKDTPVSVGVWATCEHYLEGDNEKKRGRKNIKNLKTRIGYSISRIGDVVDVGDGIHR